LLPPYSVLRTLAPISYEIEIGIMGFVQSMAVNGFSSPAVVEAFLKTSFYPFMPPLFSEMVNS
jgi:hypothetical protein